MTRTINENLSNLNIVLPEAATPVANYLSYVRSGNQLFVSGQLPVAQGKLICTGQLGNGVSVEQGQLAAPMRIKYRCTSQSCMYR